MFKMNTNYKDFVKYLNKRVNDIQSDIIDNMRKSVELVRNNIIELAPDELKPYYEEHLRIEQEGNEPKFHIVIDNPVIDISSISDANYVIYFIYKKDSKEYSPYSWFLSHNSPFVLGFVKYYTPDNLDIKVRHVSESEVEKVKKNNFLLKKELQDNLKLNKLKLVEIKEGMLDIEFSAMRYEKGLLGYETKQHILPSIALYKKNMKQYIKSL